MCNTYIKLPWAITAKPLHNICTKNISLILCPFYVMYQSFKCNLNVCFSSFLNLSILRETYCTRYISNTLCMFFYLKMLFTIHKMLPNPESLILLIFILHIPLSIFLAQNLSLQFWFQDLYFNVSLFVIFFLSFHT